MANDGLTAGFRASATRLRKEGERVAAQIDRDVRTLAKKTRAELATDVRKLDATLRAKATDTLRDIEKRTARLVADAEKRAVKAAEDVLKRLHGATQTDVAALARRIQELEHRVAELETLAEDQRSVV